MCEHKYGNKIIITMQEMMQQMDVSDKTLLRMIEEHDLPDFSYGSKWSKKKGWHVAVLERHAMEKYEQSNRLKHAGDVTQVGREDMAVMPLGGRHRGMCEQGGNLDHRDSGQKKLGRKKVSGRMRSSARQSRVAAGFPNMPT